ncbi:MAG TPA: TIGR03435 family protein [Bryobacteraceae bacterium]|nr:TIGR03435 family protein [Bryobacteraceae bacterium]
MRPFLALLIAGIAPAQSAFEVASIKPAPPPGQVRMGTGMFTYPGGRVVVSNCPVFYVIQQAFDEEQVVIPDTPAWVNDERYDMDARPPADSEAAKSNPSNFKLPPNEEQRRMLQTLLADRFQMKFHREMREIDLYLLESARSPKLQEPRDPNAYPWAGTYRDPDVFAGTNITMLQLVKRLTRMLARPVLDRTGLSGAFDFKSSYDTTGESPDSTSFLIGSLNAIGLKLESSKAPIETIVIDHIEKPTAN